MLLEPSGSPGKWSQHFWMKSQLKKSKFQRQIPTSTCSTTLTLLKSSRSTEENSQIEHPIGTFDYIQAFQRSWSFLRWEKINILGRVRRETQEWRVKEKCHLPQILREEIVIVDSTSFNLLFIFISYFFKNILSNLQHQNQKKLLENWYFWYNVIILRKVTILKRQSLWVIFHIWPPLNIIRHRVHFFIMIHRRIYDISIQLFPEKIVRFP